jgi:hypothetical protein
LKDARQIRVIHIHERSHTLATDGDEVISMVATSIGDGPIHLVVPQVFFNRTLSIEIEVGMHGSDLRVGDLEIGLAGARIWDPRPDWEQIRRGLRFTPAVLEAVQTALEQGAAASQMARWTLAPPSALPEGAHPLENSFRDAAEDLDRGARDGDRDRFVHGAARLIGLGTGLTPEGDDYLLGYMLGKWSASAQVNARRLCGWVEEVMPGQTGLLSAAVLRAAARGKCSAPWHALFKSLIDQEDRAVQRGLIGVLEYGHSSGPAALAGWFHAAYRPDETR